MYAEAIASEIQARTQISVALEESNGKHRLLFSGPEESWIRCDESGRIEVALGRVGRAEIILFSESPELTFNGFALEPMELGPNKPSTEGFSFFIDNQKIVVLDSYQSEDSLGSFTYRIFYRIQESPESQCEEVSPVVAKGMWDPEIVNRGDLGDTWGRSPKRRG